MFNRYSLLAAACTVFAASLTLNGCNLTETVDVAESEKELVELARAQLDRKDCWDADATLSKLPNPTDEVLGLRGWASLCKAGVTADKIVRTLFNYQEANNNLSVIGDLAGTVVPQDDTSLAHIEEARRYFAAQKTKNDTVEAAVNLGISYLSKAAALIAKNRHPVSGQVVRSAIASCDGGTNCSTGSAACFKNTVTNSMQDSDADLVRDAIIAAGNSIFGKGSIGAASELINRINSNFATASTADYTRCIIVTNMLRQ